MRSPNGGGVFFFRLIKKGWSLGDLSSIDRDDLQMTRRALPLHAPGNKRTFYPVGDPLQALLHREGVREVIANYCVRLDEGDIGGVIQCFAKDATADYGPGRGGMIVGATAIGERIARGQSVFRRTHHQLGQIRLTMAAMEAHTLSYVTAWHERYTGEQEIVCLRYLDTLRCTGSQWAIAIRRVEASFVDGFPDTTWNWVPRKSG